MSKKLYVGSLAYAVGDAELEKIFAVAGTVQSARVITDRMSGRSKGFGFVEMATEEEAKRAIQELNNTTHEGRAILVSEARPQEKSGGGFGGGRGGDRGGRSGGFGGRGNDRGGNRGGDRDRGGWR